MKPDALNFLYIVASLKDLVIAKQALSKLDLSPKLNPHTKETTIFIGVEEIKPEEFKIEKIKEGLYQGFYLLEVAHTDSKRDKIIKELKKRDIRLHFLGYSPGWLAQPTYLLYTGRRFPWLFKALSKNKDLVKSQKIGDN